MATDTEIATGLAKIGLYLRSEAWRGAEVEAMTPTQGQILVQLSQRGPARITALAEELAVTQPTASDAAAALLRKGHIVKRPDPGDRRATLLRITASGRRAARQLAVWPDALLGSIAVLDAAERAVFLKGLVKMVRALQLKGAIPVQRMCVNCRHFRPNAHADATAPHHCGFVDAAFGDAALRLDCGDHEAASEPEADAAWQRFAGSEGDQAGVPTFPPRITNDRSMN